MFNIDHRLTTAYHPQANGLDERFNQTLVNSISKFVGSNHDNWDEQLEEIVFSYNTAIQESTKISPFEAMFGRIARLPVDINAALKYDADEKLKQFCSAKEPDKEVQVAMQKKMTDTVKANIQKAQQKQKEYYDRKHSTTLCFKKGSVVLKKDFLRKKRRGGKLDYRWQGPYVIIASLGKGLFRLQELHGSKVSIL